MLEEAGDATRRRRRRREERQGSATGRRAIREREQEWRRAAGTEMKSKEVEKWGEHSLPKGQRSGLLSVDEKSAVKKRGRKGKVGGLVMLVLGAKL